MSPPEDSTNALPEYVLLDIYPYIAGSVFLIGSWLRYDYGQYTAGGFQSDAGSQRRNQRQTPFHIGIRYFRRSLPFAC
ncbi:respiratory nitrate reductase subunit gamma [Salmonella enterica subsp. enterica]|nr:respiratory nitrate reductase subunit gamma [Salmonella enterica subsp. enterica]